MKGIMAFLFIKTQPKNRQVPVEDEISRMKGVLHLYEVLGEYDMCVHVHAGTREELSNLLYNISTVEGVKEITTIIISKRIK
ncbi:MULTISPECIES: Lrp/AsnC family transcriptional regulator [Thermococcus]|uniref:Transcription regulator AsnC/Lrp ligand binding domain-containing protein n=2 Tax=Thermococcus barophilus TaxID=55802 RepID=A0A0S1XFI6_THEBA|nr:MULTISPECIES: Lrp/AsnC ligand binding domain-containing protein [Thermococcus]ADT82992.1 hypothetical protein TERMP_00014 [Thermococcus barophilus MP]ALM76551.1 hypothetical protein TBCH5v1_2663 [Thermococcus barophilus]WRS52297.1 Lrp/AsnC ligand binding domain-containing protein [Thermococcus sp. SY098]